MEFIFDNAYLTIKVAMVLVRTMAYAALKYTERRPAEKKDYLNVLLH